MTDRRHSIFRSADQDSQSVTLTPETEQTLAPAYRLAFEDKEFLRHEQLRPVRLQLELLKPELLMTEAGITSTVVMFGGSRIPAPAERATARTQILADLDFFGTNHHA